MRSTFYFLIFISAMVMLACEKVEEQPVVLPQASFRFLAPNVQVFSNAAYKLINESVDANTYYWDFGDGTTANEQHPFHTFNKPGKYMVTLIASNSKAEDTYSQEIIVEDDPLKLLCNASTKTWKLGAIRDRYGLKDFECFEDLTFTFSADKSFRYTVADIEDCYFDRGPTWELHLAQDALQTGNGLCIGMGYCYGIYLTSDSLKLTEPDIDSTTFVFLSE